MPSKTVTAAVDTLLSAADQSAMRTALGLGSLAVQTGTFSGTSSGTNTGDQDLSSYLTSAAAASAYQALNAKLTAFSALANGSGVLSNNGSGVLTWAAVGGSGTVTTASVVSANGFAGSVANPTTTPAITISTSITGLLKGNGTAVSAAVAGTDYTTPSGVTTLTNKRITRRIAALTDAATVTPDADSYDGGLLATLSQATTIANPTGTPTDAQQFTLRIKSTTARALTWGAAYRGSLDLPLPSTTSGGSLTDYVVFSWNAADSKWDCMGKNFAF